MTRTWRIGQDPECPNCGRVIPAANDRQLIPEYESECRRDGYRIWGHRFTRCDRCGTEACQSCLSIDPAPTGGSWDGEGYEWVCHNCWLEVELRHERRRREEYGID